MGDFREQARWMLRAAGEVMAETLWPTRCALCDMPGSVLCDRCARSLPVVDWWRACRRCGSPYGFVQCTACAPPSLQRLGRDAWPFAACASAVLFDDFSGKLVRVFKDLGEQRLADTMAGAMACQLPLGWSFDAVTYVPATLAAYRFRGFDHAETLARALSRQIDTPCVPTLARPRTRDQRTLSARQRIRNLEGRFSALSPVDRPSVLLVDDVFTTGATLCAATDALLAAGCQEVCCATFARV